MPGLRKVVTELNEIDSQQQHGGYKDSSCVAHCNSPEMELSQ